MTFTFGFITGMTVAVALIAAYAKWLEGRMDEDDAK